MNLPLLERGSVTRCGTGMAEVLRVTDPRSGSGVQSANRSGNFHPSPLPEGEGEPFAASLKISAAELLK